MTDSNLMSQNEVAKYIHSTVASMNSMRHYGRLDIPYIKIGNRIRYRKSDVDAWIDTHTINPNKKEDGDVQA